MPEVVKEERSLGDLFTELATETSTLVRQEVALAQTELTQKAVKVGTNVGFLVVGGAVSLLAVLSLLAAIIIGLTQLIYNLVGFEQVLTAAWIAALVVAVIIAVVAYFLVTGALTSLRNTDPVPHQTIESVKEDAQWVKDQVS